jgi:hypothetical protein
MRLPNCPSDHVARVETLGCARGPEMPSPRIPEVADHTARNLVPLDRHEVYQKDIAVRIIGAHAAALTHAEVIHTDDPIPVVFGRRGYSTLDAGKVGDA